MSASQLIVLTSLVAILRGLFTFPLRLKIKQALAWILDSILVGLLAFGVFATVRHREDWLPFDSVLGLRIWLQDNLGTVVFVLVGLGLVLGFRLALAREWDRAFLKAAYEWLDPFMMAGTIALILITYFVRTYFIPSPSMVPTLQVHDYIIVGKPFVLKLFHRYPPRRGDIVVFHPPIPNEKREYIKRVVGLPGEILGVRDGKVFIDGKTLEEPYIKEIPNYRFGPLKIPANHYLVFGDNRNDSEDSHAWRESGGESFLSLDRIEGKAVLIFFPLRRIRILQR